MTDPAFLFYYRHWLSSTQRMDADARGWYIQLLCHQAENGSIPNDFDELFVLAGVKPSQIQRFSECWKHTLEAKFIADDEGGLVNSFLKDKIDSRKEYTQKQANRGVVGVFIKRVKRDNNLNDSQLKELSTQLYEHDFVNLNKEERERCFKHTLEAFLQMQMQIKNNNKGVPEKSPLMFQLKSGGEGIIAYDQFELTQYESEEILMKTKLKSLDKALQDFKYTNSSEINKRSDILRHFKNWLEKKKGQYQSNGTGYVLGAKRKIHQ